MDIKGKIKVCDDLISHVQNFKNYLKQAGNECAYSDRILEDISKDVLKISEEYISLTTPKVAPNLGTDSTLVKFKDLLEDNPEEHFGLLLSDDTVFCFCCGGILEKEDYEIIEKFDGLAYLDETLKNHY